MSGWRCRPGNGSVRSAPFPEPTPPGLNHLVVMGTVCGEARQASGPQGDLVALFEMAFPVRDPERPQQLWTWASCEVEVPESAGGAEPASLQVGAPVLAGGQLSEREDAEQGPARRDRRRHRPTGDPPSDYPSGLLVPGDG